MDFLSQNWHFILIAITFLLMGFGGFALLSKGLGKTKEAWAGVSKKLHEKLPYLSNCIGALDAIVFANVDVLMEIAEEWKKLSEDGKLSEQDVAKLTKMVQDGIINDLDDEVLSILKAFVKDLPGFILKRIKHRVGFNKKKLSMNSMPKTDQS